MLSIIIIITTNLLSGMLSLLLLLLLLWFSFSFSLSLLEGVSRAAQSKLGTFSAHDLSKLAWSIINIMLVVALFIIHLLF